MIEIDAIPIDGGGTPAFIVYRPLAGLAFVGNRAMVDVASAAARGEVVPDTHAEAVQFLSSIGFLDADPPSPPPTEAGLQATTAVLLLTNQCQLRCTYCYASAGDLPRQDLSAELGFAAIDHVNRAARRQGRPQFEVAFHGGGEPVVAWDTMQACTAHARRKRLPARVSLTSNGIWTQGQCRWIIDNLDTVSLSLDGGPSTQDRQRPFVSGRGSSAHVMRTVAELDRHAFPYGIRLTATAPWDHLPRDVAFLCRETGCLSMQVEPAFNVRRGGHPQPSEADNGAFVDAFLEAFDVAVRAGRALHYSGARLGTVASWFCSAPASALIVNGLGEIVACYEVSDDTHPLAHISTLGRIERGRVRPDEPARRRLLAMMAARREGCRGCFCFWSCAGDCYARTFEPGPDGHLVRGIRCEANRSITRQLLLRGIADGGGVWRASHRQSGEHPGVSTADAGGT